MGISHSKSNRPGSGITRLTAVLGFATLAGVVGVSISNRSAVLATGTFHPVGSQGSGWVRVLEDRAGRQLELVGLRVERAADAEVRLIAASDAFDHATVQAAAFVALGTLARGRDRVSYALDSRIDLAKFRAVVVWSAASHLNLMTAPLKRTGTWPSERTN